ncbi:MAG: MoxR family ATPase [Armatimonadetes bacterium]|nr:MoxR family ATPase [Armatimonadota bacterium]
MSASVRDWTAAISAELKKVVKGQDDVTEHLLVCMLAHGHALLEGVPGLAKTLLVKCLSKAMGAEYRRVQFTPDLMPSDLTGVRVYLAAEGRFELQRGPVFTQFLLADEINRTPPKTQSALLQAMEERTVSIDGTDYALSDQFFVMATQNPIEHEGTYPLPESQLDRFLMKISINYPQPTAELEVLKLHHAGLDPHRLEGIAQIAGTGDLSALAAEIHAVKVEDKVMQYVLEIVGATRRSPQVMLGGSPRASVAILVCAKVMSAMRGRDYCIPDDVKAVAAPVLRHRLLLRPEAELEGLTADRLIDSQLAALPVPR